MTTILQDFTDFKFDTDQNLIWPAKIAADAWTLDLHQQNSVLLEYSDADRAARKFYCVSDNPLGQMQYDEFWIVLDKQSQTPQLRYIYSVNNLTDARHIITITTHYTGYTNKMQLIAEASMTPTRIRITSESMEIADMTVTKYNL